MSRRVKCKHEAEKELRDEGFVFGWLEDAYSKPNLFNSKEREVLTHSKLFRSKAGKRFIVAKDGTMYYLSN